MRPTDRKEVEKALEKKGFQKTQTDHRKFIYHTFEGKKTSVWTKTSHGSSHAEISKGNLSKMARQCRLQNADFDKLIQCPLGREEYEKLLVSQGNITLN
jgi:predicted RNA binding protein YcfA (HicA-like mRNA interferase family)